ncbi:hypothetical protein C8Q80DRAFT_1274025 [Daedaleopsis nitida]|nr:hypothetical protein C8Q80DRAFT_1274025 [Daedaleopsis nitida]
MSHGKQFTVYGDVDLNKISFVLEELGLTYDFAPLDFNENVSEHKAGAYSELNPNGRVRTLASTNATATSRSGGPSFKPQSGQGPYFELAAFFDLTAFPERIPSVERYQ